ncbi:hypothetical protein NE237_031055 [Protea cynaroides]|uniref:D-isomer specific 2-hydroxyacid dehydrogenase NAD-binding domain-containing protein n=1 Tax=Protea cynaroides TaxID=273540 RepID=A0A9Q0GUV5_9MAGN|nr:hypothetical protein NE237_031055 [Protea cynaroides]
MHDVFKFFRNIGDEDVRFKVLFCGICHSDLQCIKNDWGFSRYPLIPRRGYPKSIFTYNATYYDQTRTYGGYSDVTVANEQYVVLMTENLPFDAVAPLLCVGISMYSPMKYYGLCQRNLHLGVVGLGELGHMVVKFGKAFGMKVTVISTSLSKEKEAIEHLGADSFLISRNPDQTQFFLNLFIGNGIPKHADQDIFNCFLALDQGQSNNHNRAYGTPIQLQ